MPHTHRVNDQFDAAILSDDQFDKLTDLLEAQHEKLEGLMKPIHDIAVLLLADHAGKSDAGEDGGKASS